MINQTNIESNNYLDQLITTQMLADLLVVSTRTISDWRSEDERNQRKPRIPFIKIGSQIRYKSSEVRKFIEDLE